MQTNTSITSIPSYIIVCFSLLFVYPGFATASCTGENCACAISSEPLNFPAYNPVNGNAAEAMGAIEVVCTATSPGISADYQITFSAGNSGHFSDRHLVSNSNILHYNLFANSAYSIVLGDGSAGTIAMVDSYTVVTASETRYHTVHGLIFPSQNVPSGLYNDHVDMNIIF